jgi:putative YphP/YqiW family bacilliredoxin
MYNQNLTSPMREELTNQGVQNLSTSTLVDEFLNKSNGSSVIFINSVCGCSAGVARPAFIKSLKHNIIPSNLGTVFAGVDKEATEQARSYLEGYPASSPAITFFREGEVVHLLNRSHIEGFDVDTLYLAITNAYEKFCRKTINDNLALKFPADFWEKSVNQIKKDLQNKKIELLDCRNETEKDIANISGSKFLTKELAENIIKNWDKNKEIVFFCHHGQYSLQVVAYFKRNGFKNCYSMKGGITKWSQKIDSKIPIY